MKILTTHVGSLPRTQRTVDFIFAKEKKQKFDQNLFDKAMKEGVMEVVEKQNKVGIVTGLAWTDWDCLGFARIGVDSFGLAWFRSE